MRLILPILFVSLSLPFCVAAEPPAETHPIGGVSILQFAPSPDTVDDWSPILVRALEEIPEGGVIYFPGGRRYSFRASVELNRSLSLRFAPSAVLIGEEISALFSLRDGKWFTFEGVGGRATLEVTGKGTVIDLKNLSPSAAPDLTIRHLSFRGTSNVTGNAASKYVEEAGSLGRVDIQDCAFHASQAGVAFNQGRIKSLRLTNCTFSGQTRKAVFLACPISQDANVSANTVLEAGITAIQIGGGKAHAIDEGALDHVHSAIVHDNQILGGGTNAPEDVSYISGILVYGTNVSIQGNIVRDFHRGEPVEPGKPGHHFAMPDGTWHRGPWVYPDGKPRRRLAGSAIYAKAQFGTIANNICTNSGWRAVIEVKTGGRKPYFLVTGNMIDGSSLAIDESFGFETDTSKALWSNNLVVNMPSRAFKSTAGLGTNSFLNNVIVDSKVGLTLHNAMTNSDRTLVSGNRFLNVETPVAYSSSGGLAVDVTPPPPVFVPPGGSLPPADESQRGRFAIVAGERDRLLVVKKTERGFEWVELRDVQGGETP